MSFPRGSVVRHLPSVAVGIAAGWVARRAKDGRGRELTPRMASSEWLSRPVSVASAAGPPAPIPTAAWGDSDTRAVAPAHEIDEAEESRQDVIGLARGGALNLAGALFSQMALLAITIIIAHRLGREGVGLYSQAFAFLALLGLLSLSGFRAGLTRFVAVHRADGDAGALRGTIRLGLGLTAGSGLVMGATLFLASGWLAHSVFKDAALAVPLRFVAIALPASVFTDAALSATQGFKTMKYFAGIGMIVEPALRVSLTVAALATGRGLRGVMAALLISNVIAALLAATALRKLLGRQVERPRYHMRELFSFSTVSWFSSLAATGLIWADTIILGIMRPSTEVGVYQIASRLVLLATLAMWPVNSSFAPIIADLYRRQRWESLRRTYAVATSWILRISIPAFVVLVVFPDQALRLFGRGFSTGATVAVILVVGKMTDAATGPCGLMLNMSGRVALNMVDNVAVLVANVVLNIVLIPRYGIVGSALAWSISLVLVNLARVLQVRSTMHMFPFDSTSAKGMLSGALAMAAGLGVSHAIGGFTALVVGAAVIGVVYLVSLTLLGFPSDDRMILQGLMNRNRGLK